SRTILAGTLAIRASRAAPVVIATLQRAAAHVLTGSAGKWAPVGSGARVEGGGRVLGVVVEADPGLPAEPPEGDHPPEEGRRGVALLPVLAEHDLADAVQGVVADEVAEGEGAH